MRLHGRRLPALSAATPAPPRQGRRRLLLLAAATVAASAPPARAQLDPFLLGPDMLERLRGSGRLPELWPRLEGDREAPSVGPADASRTIVLFHDYRCPYCRELAPRVLALPDRRPDLRVLVREWPILGETSRLAATMALAAHLSGAWRAMHEALMRDRPRRLEAMLDLAASSGLDRGAIDRDRGAAPVLRHLAVSEELATALALRGTPVVVTRRHVSQGEIDETELLALIES